jgi:hypothetical protein
MDYLLEKEINGYYMALLIVPTATALVILAAASTGAEWVLRRVTGKSVGFRDLRSIFGEVLNCVGRGTFLGVPMSILGVLPGLSVAWLVVGNASLRMLKIAAPVSTLVGISSSAILFLLQKWGFRKDRLIIEGELSLVNDRRSLIWVAFGWLLGVSWPVTGVSFLLRYPY